MGGWQGSISSFKLCLREPWRPVNLQPFPLAPFPHNYCLYFPFWMSMFASCSLHLSCPDQAEGALGPMDCTRGAKSGPGARCQALPPANHTPSPAHSSPSETWVYKLHSDTSPGNFLCCWQLHTHAFPFSYKKFIPNSSSRQKASYTDTYGTQTVYLQGNIFTFEIRLLGFLPLLVSTQGRSSQ